ncbi:AMP-binding protein [Bacillus subtilis]|uniref:AMP-binding protein n=1 Tax=Bacillus subtilis TaxID=1423 RepID=UPI002DB93C62|nr:AMP-binding protein [Bacillus subtilis]MEC2335109.1 AMP-binding protein [Bacillus subtilis]
MDKLKLLMGRPILFDKINELYVRQPLISDIVDIGEEGFNELILPFVITSEAVFNGAENEEELIDKYSIYDLFFAEVEKDVFVLDRIFGGKSALGVLKDSLSFFLQTDDIEFLVNRKKIVINSNFLMDKEEYMELRYIIQGVTGRQDMQVEKPPKNMTKRQKDIWTKLQKGRRRKAEKDAIYLQDLINFTSFGGTAHIPLDQIDRMTYFQLSNAYKSVMGIDSFRIGMGYRLSYKFDVKEDIKHWTESLKIGK